MISNLGGDVLYGIFAFLARCWLDISLIAAAGIGADYWGYSRGWHDGLAEWKDKCRCADTEVRR